MNDSTLKIEELEKKMENINSQLKVIAKLIENHQKQLVIIKNALDMGINEAN